MQFNDEIIKVIDNLCEKFGITIDWTSQNVAPYLQQVGRRVVNYEMATSIVWLVVGIIALIIGLYSIKVMNTTNNYNVYLACIIFMLILIPTGVIMMITQTLNIVTAYSFPEKVVYDQLYHIYKSIK